MSTKAMMAMISSRLTTVPGSQRLASLRNDGIRPWLGNEPGAGRACSPAELALFELQYRHEGFLWDLHVPHHLQALLASLLLLQQFLLAADVAPVTLRQHILARGLHVGAADHAPPCRGLDGNVEQLAR